MGVRSFATARLLTPWCLLFRWTSTLRLSFVGHRRGRIWRRLKILNWLLSCRWLRRHYKITINDTSFVYYVFPCIRYHYFFVFNCWRYFCIVQSINYEDDYKCTIIYRFFFFLSLSVKKNVQVFNFTKNFILISVLLNSAR